MFSVPVMGLGSSKMIILTGGKSVFAKSQECSFQKMHNFLKQRLTNETPKVLLKSCLHLRRLGFPGTLLVGCVFLRGGEALGEED